MKFFLARRLALLTQTNQVTAIKSKRVPTPPATPAIMAPIWSLSIEFGSSMKEGVGSEEVWVE